VRRTRPLPATGLLRTRSVSRLHYRNGVYFRDLTTKLGVLAAHWKKVRTANLIERAFREVRRRTRPMSNFCNTESCDRIVYGVISNLNRSWERKPLPEFTQST
jgi:transposase-like protein